MGADAEAGAYDALSQHPRIADLAAMTRALMATAAETRRYEPLPDRVAELSKQFAIERDEAGTAFGNAVDTLARGPQGDMERPLVAALAAHVVRLHPPRDRDDEDRLANDLLWLATHSPFDATGLLDQALGENAASFWHALADRIRLIEQGKLATLGRGEALLAAVALSASRSKAAAREATTLGAEIGDRKLIRALFARDNSAPGDVLAGELAAAPRGPFVTALLAVTGLLLALYAARLFGRLVLAYRRPAEVRISPDGGVGLRWRTELLGRTLRDRDVVVPRAGLAQATREVRYPGVAVYGGLLALALGSYVGVAAFVDGVRAASPSLLGFGLALVAGGLAVDFVLSSVVPAKRGVCRLVFVSRTGQRLCVAGVERRSADALLSRLARP